MLMFSTGGEDTETPDNPFVSVQGIIMRTFAYANCTRPSAFKALRV